MGSGGNFKAEFLPGLQLFLGVFVLLLVPSVTSIAKMQPLSNEEMRDVVGRTRLLDFAVENGNTNYTGTVASDANCGILGCDTYQTDYTIDNTDLTFVRLKANVKITGEAIDSNNPAVGFDTMKLGNYDNSNQYQGGGYVDSSDFGDVGTNDSFFAPGVVNGNGWIRQNNSGAGGHDWDNDLADAEVGPQGASQRPVMKGPYVELAVKNHGTSNRELAGVRMGVTAAKGTIVLNMTDNYATGSVASHGNVLGIDQNMIAAGHRWEETTLGVNKIQFLDALQLGNNNGPEGNNNGWTEDLWLSINKEDIFYEYQNPAYGGNVPPQCSEGCSQDKYMVQNTDGKGFWLHVRDDNNADASLF